MYLIAAVFWLIPTPVGLEDNSWHFLGLFIAVIMAVILQVMPLGAVCMITIAIVALSGITTTQSSVRATHIKTLEGIVLRDNSNIYKTTMDEAVEAATLQALINANISRNLKAKVDEILKSSTDVNYQIENLSKIYTKATSKTSTQQLIDETKISALNTSALDVRRVDMTVSVSYESDYEKAREVISELLSSYPEVLNDPAPTIEVNMLSASSVDFIVRPWTKNSDYWTVYWKFQREIVPALSAKGIEVPYNKLDITVKKD